MKDVSVLGRGIKVLSLFFIDRVANYRTEDGGAGQFAKAFEEEFAALAKEDRFKAIGWLKEPIGKLHDGYFSQDKKGAYKDTSGSTQADDTIYELIMQKKEELLAIDTPLRFIFSHSALREGWDNPNVFQICTLNQTTSGIKKRQEIGRGLRLPVDRDGMRVFDESVNRLYVMANESYEDFARALQTEYEEDCGVSFGKVPLTALARITRVLDGKEVPIGKPDGEIIRIALVAQKMLDPDGRIGAAFDPKKVGFALTMPASFEDLQASVIDVLSSHQIERHVRRDRDERSNKLRKEILATPEFRRCGIGSSPRPYIELNSPQTILSVGRSLLLRKWRRSKRRRSALLPGSSVSLKVASMQSLSARERKRSVSRARSLPDVLAYLQNETELTRSTLVRILRESGRLAEIFANPQRFLDQVAAILKFELHRLLVDGIKYEKMNGKEAEWEQALFKNEELVNFLTAQPVTKAPYEYVVYDLEIERAFAQGLESREDIRVFMKLPDWFKVDTPLGAYNPDWAILKKDSDTIYLVRETKGTKDFLKLRTTEADKVRCGKAHFDALGVPFEVVVTASEI